MNKIIKKKKKQNTEPNQYDFSVALLSGYIYILEFPHFKRKNEKQMWASVFSKAKVNY